MIAAVVSALAVLALAAPQLQDCERRIEQELEDGCTCLQDAGAEPDLRQPAMARLAQLRDEFPGNPWPTSNLAGLVWYQDRSRAADLYEEAAGEFERHQLPARATTALLNAARMRSNAGEYEAAFALTRQATAVAEEVGDPSLSALVTVDHAHFLYTEGRDPALAYELLRRVEPVIRGIDAAEITNWLDSAAQVTYTLGMMGQSLAYRRHLIALLEDSGDDWSLAQARYGYAITFQALYPEPDEYERLLREAMETANAGDNRRVGRLALMELGKLAGGAEGETMLERCMSEAQRDNSQRDVVLCGRALAGVVRDTDIDRAVHLIDESIALATEIDDLQARVHSASERVLIRWASMPRNEAIDDALRTLDLIETYRLLQSTESGRVGLFSSWVPLYDRIVGLLLSSEGRTDREVATAFEVLERRRARTLLDALERGGALPSPVSSGASADYAEALRAIVEVQSSLLDPLLTASARDDLLTQLGQAELNELAVRRRLASEDIRFLAWTRTAGTLSAVQRVLSPNEALLTYQLAPSESIYGNFAGGAWVGVVTAESVRFETVEDVAAIEDTAPLIAGLASQRLTTLPPTTGLSHSMFGDALAELPASIDSLIIVPDGAAHQLPFATLTAPDGRLLADRFAITLAPSATLWWRWRISPHQPTSNALVFANPRLGDTTHGAFVAQLGGAAPGTRLGPLPYANVEADHIADHLGHLATLVKGDAATEHDLKQRDLSSLRVLHFAAHAVVDERLPERSAIYLAPGSDSEDGLLQDREISALSLGGALVVLSGCQSAAGNTIDGEGVMSLARSFFQAGATSVVASLWPLRDDDAAAFFDAFYRHLGSGTAVAEAHRLAQADLRAAGAPTAAWAGIVVLGDGAAVPYPGGLTAAPTALILLLGMVAALLGAFLGYAILARPQA